METACLMLTLGGGSGGGGGSSACGVIVWEIFS